MGVIPGAQITLVKFAPMGDPIEFRIPQLRADPSRDDAKQIEISAPCSAESDPPCPERLTPAEHPGLGEGGRYHVKAGNARCRMERSSPLRWRATRTAAKQPCSTS